MTQTAPEIRSQLDDWLWVLSIDPTATLPAADVAMLRTAWAALKPKLPEAYRPIIDDRLALLDSYLSRSALR